MPEDERAEVCLHPSVPRFGVAYFIPDHGRKDRTLPVTAVLHVLLPCLWPWTSHPVQLGGRRTGGGRGLYAYRMSESQAIGVEPDALPPADRHVAPPVCPRAVCGDGSVLHGLRYDTVASRKYLSTHERVSPFSRFSQIAGKRLRASALGVALALSLTTSALAQEPPRLSGIWVVDRTVSASRNTEAKRGYHDRAIWRFAPNCAEGTCSVVLTRRVPHGAAVTVLLRPHGDNEYVGEDRYLNSGSCGRRSVGRVTRAHAIYTLRITAARNGRATVLRGTQETTQTPTEVRCEGKRWPPAYERFAVFGRA